MMDMQAITQQEGSAKVLAVAPMMAWTDRHCRRLHRLFSPNALLFTEMVTTGALVQGNQWHQLDHSQAEHPLALQLGGSEPDALAVCAERAEARGFAEINLNVGCPSERVQNGAFGACLMREPELVAACIAAMRDACGIPVTVKCRLGVDELDNDTHLAHFVETVADAGCGRFYLHARKAILKGLSPAQNRSIPPLQYDRVERLKRRLPNLEIIVNGGIDTLEQADDLLRWADGVMIGRAAYHHPTFLGALDAHLHGGTAPTVEDALLDYRGYIAEQLSRGVRLHSMTRHLLSVCHGLAGARRYRQTLSNQRRLKLNDIALYDEAVGYVFARAA